MRNDPHNYDMEDLKEVDQFLLNNDWINETDHNEDECEHPDCSCTPPNNKLSDYIEYYSPDKAIISTENHNKLKQLVKLIDEKQTQVDWHPGSNMTVKNLIHPSLYCYIKGETLLNDGSKEKCTDNESTKYQWLPSDIKIDEHYNIKWLSRINGLLDNTALQNTAAELFGSTLEQFIPSLEKVIGMKLQGKQIQIIPKIASTILNNNTNLSDKYTGGSWHIEGMPYEHIIATCIHYIDVSGITDSYLEFRKPTIINEQNSDLYTYPQSDHKYTSHHFGIEDHFDGQMNRYLGLIKATECASTVFPNTIQHRVKEFKLLDNCNNGTRTILAFFVIDPNVKIISTSDVPDQSKIISLNDAKKHRERLMFHRKYFVQQLNETVFERPFSLCEH